VKLQKRANRRKILVSWTFNCEYSDYRVKGTEMYWNDPEGAAAILQVRAAALSDDERLAKHLGTRPGCPFTRRPKRPKVTTKRNKS